MINTVEGRFWLFILEFQKKTIFTIDRYYVFYTSLFTNLFIYLFCYRYFNRYSSVKSLLYNI